MVEIVCIPFSYKVFEIECVFSTYSTSLGQVTFHVLSSLMWLVLIVRKKRFPGEGVQVKAMKSKNVWYRKYLKDVKVILYLDSLSIIYYLVQELLITVWYY